MRQYFVDDKGVERIIQLAIENWWVGDRESWVTQWNCLQPIENEKSEQDIKVCSSKALFIWLSLNSTILLFYRHIIFNLLSTFKH